MMSKTRSDRLAKQGTGGANEGQLGALSVFQRALRGTLGALFNTLIGPALFKIHIIKSFKINSYIILPDNIAQYRPPSNQCPKNRQFLPSPRPTLTFT